MSNIGTLMGRIGEAPPTKRWTMSYLACVVGGFLLSTYAESISNRLAPRREALEADTVTTGADLPADDDEPGDPELDVDAPSLRSVVLYPDPSPEYLDVETPGKSDDDDED